MNRQLVVLATNRHSETALTRLPSDLFFLEDLSPDVMCLSCVENADRCCLVPPDEALCVDLIQRMQLGDRQARSVRGWDGVVVCVV